MWLLRRGANYNVRTDARRARATRAGVWGKAPREEDSCEEIRMFLRD
jgi:hypothetical protein